MKKRVNCFVVTCKHCQNHILVKCDFWGNKFYICPAYPQKHKAISGHDCGMFICDYQHYSLVCDDCYQKTKRLER